MSDAGAADIDAEFDAFDTSALAALDAIEAAHVRKEAGEADTIDESLGEALLNDLHDIDAEVSEPVAPARSQRQVQQTLLSPVEHVPPVHTAPGLMLLAPGARRKEWDNSAFLRGKQFVEPPTQVDPAVDRDAARTWIYPVNKPLRTYQLNIVKKALFHNVLVALPTGLGKTFIAAVVILNMFRWFPSGKIIFVAPTRPLVAQQQQACHAICGLPWDTAIELTGQTRRGIRDDEWKTKRIFYMTPQTFENDLLSSACDPRDVVCVVVDEAHRATGNYAYCTVIRHLMYHNPRFRVLALTATPGSTAERVQEVVDNLHIDMIELRTEGALDIQPYIHRKREEIVSVELDAQLEELRAAWAELMRTYLDPLQTAGIFRNGDPLTMRPFAVRATANEPAARAILAQRTHLRNNVTQLAAMALAMQYLGEHSVRVFSERVRTFEMAKGASKKSQIFSSDNPKFAHVLALLDALDADTLEHPKIGALRDVLHDHFNKHAIRNPDSGGTRAMVFCSYREVVSEIVDALRASGISATPFIGQATDAKGNRGLTQRRQEEVVSEFRDGKIQVLVATSIGEEGLDIGDVDLIVCYEAVRDSVRALQRIGRTGRKRDGRIVVLATRREEHNWKHSKESYRHVQKLVRAANTIALYTDVARILPSDLRPEPVLTEVAQPPFDPTMLRAPRRTKEPKKPKREAKQPLLAQFCSASDLRREWASQREGGMPQSDTSRSLLEDDSDDAELSTDPAFPTHSSEKSAPAASSDAFSWSPTPAASHKSTPPLFLSTPSPPRAFERYKSHPIIAALEQSPVRSAQKPRLPVAELSDSSDESDTPLASHAPNRATAKRPQKRPQKQPQKQPQKRQRNALFVTEAERDTSSDEHGESDEDDDGPDTDEADDEDREAVGDFVATQEPGYNQQGIYMQSMLSQQAPTPFRGRDRLAELLQRRAAARPPSEPPVSADEYSQDSFVVDDDEIEWAETQSSLPA